MLNAIGGVLWNPRTYVHPTLSASQNCGRLTGFEYIDSHIAPPQPASQDSCVWLLM